MPMLTKGYGNARITAVDSLESLKDSCEYVPLLESLTHQGEAGDGDVPPTTRARYTRY